MRLVHDQTWRDRQMVDAIRQCLGLDPLYGVGETAMTEWLGEVEYAHCQGLDGMTIRGSDSSR